MKLNDYVELPGEFNDVLNIFEDERIETVLKDYYYGVNFKKTIIMLNNYNPDEKPKDIVQNFYYIVRFRNGREDFVERVEQIIYAYHNMTRASYGSEVKMYVQRIQELFRDCSRDWLEKNDPESLDKATKDMYGDGSKYSDANNAQKNDIVQSMIDGMSEVDNKDGTEMAGVKTIVKMTKEEFKKFVIENYVSTIDEHDMLKISSGEIVNYLCSEKHDFVMIEYFGDTSSIEQNFSFVSNKIYKKFLLHFVISPTTGFLELAETVERLGKVNICSDPEYITHIEIDDTLRKDKFKFRILSPCYTYLDIWTFK